MEFESFDEGTLLYIGIPEGETAPVDSLAIIGDEGEDVTALCSEIRQKQSQNRLNPKIKNSTT
jgi:pyruvate/2-oxoglutarate dehydrogenase complex dihydrolipoamide acyltransferase (E2) component